ncbi:MAG: GNAT family N-acetyltransferase [Planctomycetota bacterium]
MLTIRPADHADLPELVRMSVALLPGDADEARSDVLRVLEDARAQTFVAQREDAHASGSLLAGYAEVSFRSYADGCGLDTPYLEAWYVDPDVRQTGVGRALVTAVEDWARQRGSVWLGSDCLLDNATSESAHKAVGFEEVDRVIQFRRALGR